VKEYLTDKGIDSKRISGIGFGGTKPIASNDTEESRRMNRRVEFTIKRF
jgi:outer membrane protein OmpA-like peptidoglycan-associated protein